jgi:hypothetical protein
MIGVDPLNFFQILKTMANTPKDDVNRIERREFLKKTGMAGALAAGFPAIISGQSVTNSLKVGLVGCGGQRRPE